MTPMMQVPNIDAMDDDDLITFATTTSILAQYAMFIAGARGHRLAGDIETAIYWEEEAQRSYDSLPGWARW